jgi:hypothetical protein
MAGDSGKREVKKHGVEEFFPESLNRRLLGREKVPLQETQGRENFVIE